VICVTTISTVDFPRPSVVFFTVRKRRFVTVKKTLAILALACLVGFVAYADNIARDKQVNMTLSGSEAPEALHTLDYFFSGPAGTYTWTGLFYMSNMFKPDPLWYPFGIMTVEVNPAQLDGATTTGAMGTIDGVRVFTGTFGYGATVNVVASRLNLTGAAVGTWYPVVFTAATAVVINSGNFWAGMWNSSYVEGGLQGEATGWVTPPVEPFECINSPGTAPNAGGPGPWTLHLSGNCGDQYATTSAATVRVTVDDAVPVELMRFSID
jgi:hypothetical protein